VSDWSSIKLGRDLTEEHVAEAIESRESVKALLRQLAQISKPGTGGARVLLLFAGIATPECEWLEGALRVEITGQGDSISVSTVSDIGGGLKERVLPVVTLNFPLAELTTTIVANPQSIAPLLASRPAEDRLVLTAEEVEKTEREEEAPVPAPVPDPVPVPKPKLDPKKTQIAVAHLPTVNAAPARVAPPVVDEPPPMAELAPGEVPPPLEFSDLEGPTSAPLPTASRPLGRIALKKKQIRRNVVVEEERVHSPGRSEEADDDDWK